MRKILIELNNLYGAQHTRALTVWLNEQLIRRGIFDGGTITLQEVDETAIIATLKHLAASVPLNAAQLIEHVYLVPAMDTRQINFECVARFKASFYTLLITADLQITINNLGVVREGDKIERVGYDQHIGHKPAKNNDKCPITMVYINGTVKADKSPFSMHLSTEEIEGVYDSHVNKLFNGIDPYDTDMLPDVFLASMFNRLFDEDIFSVISRRMSDDALDAYAALKQFNGERYQQQHIESSNVYSSFGKLVAKKKVRFTATEKLEQKRHAPVTLQVIQGKKADIEISNTESYGDIATEFGGF